MSWMDLLSVWTNRQSLPSSMMSEYPKYAVLPCSNISSIEGPQFTLGLSKFKNPCLYFKALWIHVSIEVIRRILCLREMWIQSHVPTSVWYTCTTCEAHRKEQWEQTVWDGLMLTRGSFCRSVWGTAPGRAPTSMGLDAWQKEREKEGKKYKMIRQILLKHL